MLHKKRHLGCGLLKSAGAIALDCLCLFCKILLTIDDFTIENNKS
jgi:hypothetical protein